MSRLIILLLSFIISTFSWAQSFKVIVHLDESAKQPLTGRLYVFSTTDTTKRVPVPDEFSPNPCFHIDIKNWQAGQAEVLDAAAPGYPVALNKLSPGYYKFTSVLDIDTVERNNFYTPGNWYSSDAVAEIKTGNTGEVHLWLSKQVTPRVFKNNDSIKEVVLKSELLSRFHQKDIYLKAAVVLPHGFEQNNNKQYPVVFVIPGWGGTHYDALSSYPAQRYGFAMGKQKIFVYLNPETQTRWGLHSFVDSRVNGPWGKAVVEELTPYLVNHYHASPDADLHFVMGQSSGGYGALWLQLNYPKAFNGCWAVSPDPVDFSDFLSVDIYEKNANLFFDATTKERPFFLLNGVYQSSVKHFCDVENFIGDGGQMQAFEAEFGVPDKNGRPQELYNRQTGAINPKVARAWKPYDLGELILHKYAAMAKDLSGKVHVYAGKEDNFYLDGAVKLFAEKASKANANVTAELIPGANHWTIWSPDFTKRVQQELDERIK